MGPPRPPTLIPLGPRTPACFSPVSLVHSCPSGTLSPPCSQVLTLWSSLLFKKGLTML